MSLSVSQLLSVKSQITVASQNAGRAPTDINLVAVSKTFAAVEIEPVLQAGHRVFGENRVQEAKNKWPDLKSRYQGVELHLIGPLQSNKAAEAVALFDVIETVDRPKIALALAAEIRKQQTHTKLFIQVNIGLEPQKAGILPESLDQFVPLCREAFGKNLIGLMCIPPADQPAGPYFATLRGLAAQHKLPQLSMGMSADFAAAIAEGATYVRVGSAIFGNRPQVNPL